MSLEYKVPRILWENLESVLLAQSRRYIGELARHLGVSEKELQKRVLPTSDSLKVILQDSQLESNQCKAYVQHDQLTVFCKKPVAYHSEYCAVHRTKRMMVIELPSENDALHIVQKIKDRHTMEPMWLMNHIVINSNGDMIGKINKTEGIMKRFIIEVPKSI
jgi:hypothetical protein